MLSEYLDTIFDWKKEALRRFIVGLAASILWAVVTLSILNLIMLEGLGLNNEFFSWQGFLYFSMGTALVSIIITGFFNGRQFLIFWKEAELDAEKLRSEVMKNQYDNLKNQVNPHFLFNSFNTLNTLIYEDRDLAARYTKTLSEVYRYILEAGKDKWVSLKKELDFCRSYAFLHKIRLGENLSLKIDEVTNDNIKVIPCSIQMLIENVIKHNEISDEKPLEIRIRIGEDKIWVENRKQLKNMAQRGTGTGLENITNQYRILLNKDIVVENENDSFKVGLPLAS